MRLRCSGLLLRSLPATLRRTTHAMSKQPCIEAAGSRSTVELVGWRVEGVSTAGQETCVLLPDIKVAIDSGRCPRRSVAFQQMFITHGHMDHVGGVPFHAATRALLGAAATQVYAQPSVCEAVQEIMAVHSRLEGDQIPIECNVLEVGGEVAVKDRFRVRPFNTVHTVPSQGYIVYDSRQKLREMYMGMSGRELGKLRKQGVTLTETIETAEVAVTGDTSIDFVHLAENADVLRARLLVMECTFLDDKVDQQGARDRGHMHIKDIAEQAHLFQNEAILLLHFSARYSPQEIVALIDQHLPNDLRRRVYPWLEGFGPA